VFGTVEAVFSMAEYFVLVLLCPTIAGLVLSVLDTPPTYPRVLRSVSLLPFLFFVTVSALTDEMGCHSACFRARKRLQDSASCGSGRKHSAASSQGWLVANTRARVESGLAGTDSRL
jgi:hypothetical protein